MRRKNKNNKDKKTTPATPPVEKITKYFERKEIVNKEDNKVKSSATNKSGISINVSNTESMEDNPIKKLTKKTTHEVSQTTKKTFSDISRDMKTISLKDRIRNYEIFQSGGENIGCILVNGRCEKHKIMLTREVNKKRVSHTNQHGEVSWTMREGTILVCPRADQRFKGDDITITSNPGGGGSANKKQRIIEWKGDDPITGSNTVIEELPLDNRK